MFRNKLILPENRSDHCLTGGPRCVLELILPENRSDHCLTGGPRCVLELVLPDCVPADAVVCGEGEDEERRVGAR